MTQTEMLRKRAQLLAQVRAYFAAQQVLEVQTPVLGRHGVTDPDIACIPVAGYGYLQSSPEYFLKRLLVAGVPSCYQMGPAFRADEQGRLHAAEFTLLEWYRLGFDHVALMADVAALVDQLLGPASYQYCSYASLVDDLAAPREVLDLQFSQACEQIDGRCFVIDYPADQAALARLLPDQPAKAARFELIIDGVEIANGYWELTDADEHRRRFAQDQAVRQARGLAPMAIDDAFVHALDDGLPDCAGVALGIDRLVMLAVGASRIAQVMAFDC